jgi:ubiquinone biosynthesis protein
MPSTTQPTRNHTAARLHRAREVVRVFLAHGLGAFVDQGILARHVPWWRWRSTHEPHLTQPQRLRLALGELGVTFTKLGQMLSTRADLLPREYIEELSRLQDSAPPVPFEAIERVLREDLAHLPEWPFVELDPAPLASASIGQVHAATLRNGTRVVVKVRKPGVVEQVELDLSIVRGMMDWVQHHTALGNAYDLVSITDTFAHSLRHELDYGRECRSVLRVRRAFAGDPDVNIPRVWPEFGSERVLVMERVSGIRISDLEAIDRAGLSRRRLAENGVRLFLSQLLEHGFFHADPHPGNFFVQPDGSVTLIDFGMMGHVNPNLQRGLLAAGVAAVRRDPEQLADVLFGLGVAGERVNRAAFEKDLDHLLTGYDDRSLQEMSATAVVDEFTRITFRHRLVLPGDLALLLRVTTMSEGIGLRLDPDFKFLDYATALLKRTWRRRHSPAATMQRLTRALGEGFELGLELPRRLTRLLARAERGDLQLTVHHRGLRHVTAEFQRMTNRLALAVILGASLIALGLAAGIRHVPALEPVILWFFRLGLVFSLLFGLSIVWTMWRSGRGR